MFAIRSKADKRWVYGTDYRCSPAKQRLSYERAKLFEDRAEAESQFGARLINPARYEVVEVLLMEAPTINLPLIDILVKELDGQMMKTLGDVFKDLERGLKPVATAKEREDKE